MAIVLLVRHGRTSANASGVLAGRSPGVLLDAQGIAQAAALAERLAPLPLARVVSSPLERTRATAEALVVGRDIDVEIDERLAEADYGSWTGKKLSMLAKDPLWKAVQAHPSSVTFPEGESMAGVAARAAEAVRAWDALTESESGPDGITVLVSHGDVIKSVAADALGLHLDGFQRIACDPCSVTAIRYTPLRPFLLHQNDTGTLASLAPPKRKRRRTSDAPVGGGAGGH